MFNKRDCVYKMTLCRELGPDIIYDGFKTINGKPKLLHLW